MSKRQAGSHHMQQFMYNAQLLFYYPFKAFSSYLYLHCSNNIISKLVGPSHD